MFMNFLIFLKNFQVLINLIKTFIMFIKAFNALFVEIINLIAFCY